jgi:hypothetical protein
MVLFHGGKTVSFGTFTTAATFSGDASARQANEWSEFACALRVSLTQYLTLNHTSNQVQLCVALL